jgi:hypothetical protein
VRDGVAPIAVTHGAAHRPHLERINRPRRRRKTLSGRHLQIGIEFQRWGSLPRPSASCPVWNRSAPFGAPDSQYSIPTTLAHPARPGTAPDPHRRLPVDNLVIYRESPVSLRRGQGVAMGREFPERQVSRFEPLNRREGTSNIQHPTSNIQLPGFGQSLDVGRLMLDVGCSRGSWRGWAVLLAAADTSSEGPKCPSSRVLHASLPRLLLAKRAANKPLIKSLPREGERPREPKLHWNAGHLGLAGTLALPEVDFERAASGEKDTGETF